VSANKKTSDYGYQRFIVRTPELHPSTVSIYRHGYSFLCCRVEGRKPRAFSKLVLEVADKLHLDGYAGTPSKAARMGVRAML
jgi:hypothetical protein